MLLESSARTCMNFGARAAAIVLALSLGTQFSLAADDNAEDSDEASQITVYTRDAAATAPGGAADQLVTRAQQKGRVRVIVGLRTTMRMEHTLRDAQVTVQRSMLQRLQNDVASRVLGSPNAAGVERFTFIPYMSMFVNAAQLRLLLADPEVVSLQEEVPSPPSLAQSAPLIHANSVWLKGYNGSLQTIAILDTGADKTHPMLVGRVVSEACYSTTDLPDYRSVCPAGLPTPTSTGAGVHCNVAWTGCDHGTHVAGIAAGNSSTLDGIARTARIISIQVFSRLTTTNPDSVRSWPSDQIKGLERVYALRNARNIAAVNMSLGGGKHSKSCDTENPALTTAIKNLRDVGIATIIASGNNGYTGSISSPACISHAIAVGNTQKNDLIANSSNHSALVKLMAPGTSINSAEPGGTYQSLSGTSMAAPHVAGAFALLRNVKPTATLTEVLEALSCSGKGVEYRVLTGGVLKAEVGPPRPRIDLLGAYNHLRKPSNVIRAWQFSGAAELNDWSPIRGNWSLSGGTYRATPQANGIVTRVANCNTKLTITARLRRVDTAMNTGTHWNSGIMFKATTNFLTESVSGYWVSYNRCRANAFSGHCTGLNSDKRGQALFYRVSNFNHNTGGSVSTLLCVKHIPIVDGGYNTIRVVSNGSSHSYYLNNKLVCTVNDSTYVSGGVTLNAFFPKTLFSGHSIAYDSLSIQSIGANDVADDAVMDPESSAPIDTPATMNVMSSSSPVATVN